MPKKPKPIEPSSSPTLFSRLWGKIKRNPGKTILTTIVVLGGIPTAAAGYGMIASWVDPAIPVLRYELRDTLMPIRTVQNTQATAIDRFLLYQQQRDLAAALADPAARNSRIVQDTIKNLQEQVKDTEDRIHKATRK